jgi:hypothetical protein
LTPESQTPGRGEWPLTCFAILDTPGVVVVNRRLGGGGDHPESEIDAEGLREWWRYETEVGLAFRKLPRSMR